MTKDEVAEIVRKVLEDEYEEKPVISDGGSALDAYQQFEADRNAWRKKQFAELQAISDGSSTPEFGAALMQREQSWQRRGEQQSRAWQRSPAAAPTSDAKPLAPNAPLADAAAAREAAWRKRGELQQNAWRR